MPGGPKVDEADDDFDHGDPGGLAGRYEALRATALGQGVAAAGLGGALVVSKGMAAWMRGWRACRPQTPLPTLVERPASAGEVVDVLAAMALACA